MRHRPVLYQCLAIVAAAAACLTACRSAPPTELRDRFEADGGPSVEVRVVVQPEQRGDAPRYLSAAVASLRTLTPWLGPFPYASLSVVDPPWHGAANAAVDDIVIPRTPWWSTAASMAPELATARAVARRYFADVVDKRELPDWFVDGLVEYLARRIVVPLFELTNLPPGYAMFEARYFGGFVPRFVRLRRPPETDGPALSAYRARPRVDANAPASADSRVSLTGKTMSILNTLERWLSPPVFTGAVAEFVRSSRGSQPMLADFARVVSDASGYDLSWLFDQTLEGQAVFDYSVADLASVRAASGKFETTVVVARLGDGLFTGTSTPRVGSFESGRGMALLVNFADGAQAIDRWDGRDARKTFAYRSDAPAVSATIDPEHVLVLDLNLTNNGRTLAPQGGRAAIFWAARWMFWFEHALLTYAALV
jgi:hypothetical protein